MTDTSTNPGLLAYGPDWGGMCTSTSAVAPSSGYPLAAANARAVAAAVPFGSRPSSAAEALAYVRYTSPAAARPAGRGHSEDHGGSPRLVVHGQGGRAGQVDRPDPGQLRHPLVPDGHSHVIPVDGPVRRHVPGVVAPVPG